ncbi:MAG: hypothetical protein KBF52_08470 [Pyrinomonadaceae bacterium]|nr:hypothetical protein [Chloracidobacterium sp.]MBL0241560.1 hypothetical protein [Chloracidobacterium sp.]MBP9935796.1 hypothetical protein [Pyrinomonadaceae bacterium]
MNKETRTQKIAEIMLRDAYGKQDILWHDRLEQMSVFEIPLEYLVYNKFNGRILSRTKTLEKQGRNVNPETKEGKFVIEELLWRSKVSKNEITKKDISIKGQLKIGIVTRDGIVIDGNRRLMLLNKLQPKYRFFKAVVLPVALEDDPIEVEKLETTYQMGEDEKQGYNPIEKYLKAKQIYNKLIAENAPENAIGQIANWMGEEKSEIQHYLDVMDVIDEYLQYLEYDGIYAMADTPNDGKEDLFLYLKKWLKTFGDGKESTKAFDGYEQLDVDDLKNICFDFVRAKIGKSYDGKSFRHIADGQRKNHFFGDAKIWKDFADTHFSIVSPAVKKINSEYPIDYNSENIEASLSNRDAKFRDEVLEGIAHNLEEHQTDLGYLRAADKPLELVTSARKAIDSIQQGHKNFSQPEVLERVEDLIQTLTGMLIKKSPEETLSLVLSLLQGIDLDSARFDEEIMLANIKNVSKAAYQMEKRIKAS